MSQQQLDAQGEAHDALDTAVSSYGRRVLSDPHILGNLVTDLLPDLPRERSLLVSGAEAGIAAEMTQHVEEQHIDPDTAVQLVARSLAERRSIDPAASMWVATEYARALGYQVRPFAQPSWPGEPEGIPAAPPTVTALSGPPMATQPPPAAPVPPQGPPPQSWPPQGPAPQSWPPPQGPPPQSWPPAQPPSGGAPPATNRSKRGPVIAAIAVAGAVVLYLIIAAVAQTFPFTKSHPAEVQPPPTPAPTPTPAHSTTPAPTPSATLARGITPLMQLLPGGVADPTTQCSAIKKPAWSSPGLVTALSCNDTNLPKGYVYGYQMDNRADYNKTWRNFNSWAGFDSSSAQSSCPPSSSSAQAITTWNSKNFPTMAGQVLECWTNSDKGPVYVWTLPTQNTFFLAVGADGSSFKALDDWWVHDSEPASLPTATQTPQAS